MNNLIQITADAKVKMHSSLLEHIGQAYDDLSKEDNFKDKWTANNCYFYPSKKQGISYNQTFMLGKGGGALRQQGGFRKFAESIDLKSIYPNNFCKQKFDRFDHIEFDKKSDFVMYTATDWYKGHKLPIMIVEVEQKEAELLGEFSNLLSIRAPLKYLFIQIAEENVDAKINGLNQYVLDSHYEEVPNTTFYISIIPFHPMPPSQWTTFKAESTPDSRLLQFKKEI
jgi:hypothetical protein